MKFKNILFVLSLGVMPLVQQCVSTGNNFPSRTDWIKANQTTQKDVRLVLGDPFSVGSSDGTLTWTYAYYLYPLFKQPVYKELKLYWDNDKVQHYSFTSNFPADVKPQLGPSSKVVEKSNKLLGAKSKNP